MELLEKGFLVKIYHLHLPEYCHYLTMRTVDYLLLQLKELLLYPYNLNEYFDKFVPAEISNE